MARFVSFSQNYEDVILWRALRHIPHGFYVDCGAFHPEQHSVTKAFYDRGWRGINCEPLPSLLSAFTERRSADLNLGVAISNHGDGTTLYEIVSEFGLSTVLPEIAGRHVDAGHVARAIEVPTARLSDILQQAAPTAIHFLKIDVEGAEQLVLDGLDLMKFRPWIILIEATQPLSQQPSYRGWEPQLLASGYDFVYFDGLNRFYLAQEHAELRELLAVPPNVFDDFVQVEQLGELEQTRRELTAMKQSISWRLTAPLRALKAAWLDLCAGGLSSGKTVPRPAEQPNAASGRPGNAADLAGVPCTPAHRAQDI